MRFKAVQSDRDIAQVKELVIGRKLQLLREHSAGVDRLWILTPRGESAGYIHTGRFAEMLQFFNEHSNEDGLLEGCSQTAGIGPSLAGACSEQSIEESPTTRETALD